VICETTLSPAIWLLIRPYTILPAHSAPAPAAAAAVAVYVACMQVIIDPALVKVDIDSIVGVGVNIGRRLDDTPMSA
jgi:hypothetical protein